MDMIKCYRIPGHESANAKIVTKKRVVGGESYVTDVSLVSYFTDVMGLRLAEGGVFELYINGLYSMTTRKHISWFCGIYPGPLTYYAIKGYIEDGLLRSDGGRDASIAEAIQVINIAHIVEQNGKQLR